MLMLFKPAYPVWLEHLKIKRDSKLLDVGCGDGAFLYWLHDHGYSALWGVDAFLSPDFSGAPDLRIEKGTISDITEHDFDFVTLHHSLEHMIDHDTVLTDIYRVLRSGGCALIRTPINSYAWKEYGVNWVQLDAPRHLLIHSEKSMKMLAYRNGFKVSRVVYDSNEFMYWGSEQYLRDMPLSHPRSHSIDPANSLFSRSDMTRFRDEASRMNAIGCGDQACFFLTKP
jgi:SAM-dependent methyltransferase